MERNAEEIPSTTTHSPQQPTQPGTSAAPSAARAIRELDDVETLIQQKEREGFVVLSMKGNGDCMFEMMCKWKMLLDADATFDFQNRDYEKLSIEMVRSKLAVFQMKYAARIPRFKWMISQTLQDWYLHPEENSGRNAVVVTEKDASGCGDEWFGSQNAIDLHSKVVARGVGVVYGESPELEAFALSEKCQVKVFVPGDTYIFPQSILPSHQDYPTGRTVYGMCAMKHYYLLIPPWDTISQVSSFYLSTVISYMYGLLKSVCMQNYHMFFIL